MSAEAYQAAKWEREIEDRNRPLSDEELDAILPPEGFKVCTGMLASTIPRSNAGHGL